MKRGQKIHFVGIGGIGMSALARYFMDRGVSVSGYDKTSSALTGALISEGARIWFDPSPESIDESYDLVVYTPAIPRNHPEIQAASDLQIPLKKRAEVLGEISRHYTAIAVAGTHGKTTTSTMLADVLVKLGLEPLVILGGVNKSWNSNYYGGKGPLMVTEADEYDRSFLQLHPKYSIINSLDPDHLDIYGDGESMTRAYQEFVEGHPSDARILVFEDALVGLDRAGDHRIFSFGFSGGVDFRVEIKSYARDHTSFDLFWKDQRWSCKSFMPGKHNVLNMAAGLSLICLLGEDVPGAIKMMEDFEGIDRRFEKRFEKNGVVIIDDYAHHPEEIKAAISTARNCYPGKKLHVVFQAHLYTRTRDFLEDFAKVLSEADVFYSCALYPAREVPIEGVSGRALFDKVKASKKIYAEMKALPQQIKVQNNDVILVLGAGNIHLIIDDIIREIG